MYVPIYCFRSDIAKVQHLLAVIRIERNDVDQVLMHQTVIGRVDRHVPNVILVSKYDPRLNVVPSLARVLVGLPLVPALVAFAVETAGRILALLAAHLRRFDALVNVVAGLPVGQQLVAGIALAVEAGRRIHALVPALIQLDAGALVHVAVQRLVALVGAVRLFVTNQLRVDAVAVRAHEVLRIRARCVLPFRR